MNLFDWLHDVTKGEDTLKPILIRTVIVLIVTIILWNIWSILR